MKSGPANKKSKAKEEEELKKIANQIKATVAKASTSSGWKASDYEKKIAALASTYPSASSSKSSSYGSYISILIC